MELAAKYNPSEVEDKWYKYWLEHKLFESKPDNRKPYTIVIPPPNVTGVLHMGHILNNTIQDVLIRRARMLGYNACWVPGTDHASIATEAKVVDKLRKEGISKKDLTREKFLEHAWDWTRTYGGIILEQLKKLGASCDWSRTCFTMDDSLSESVINVFVDLYNKGKVYRGTRMVNWDTAAKTAVSDEEVEYKEVSSKLYYVRYKVADTEEWLTIATTRPETILGDTAVCVNPEDQRYIHLKGKKIIIPLVNREVPIIFDEIVDKEFGTGALKVTPAHDANDYMLGQKYKLDFIEIFNEDGTLSKAAQWFVGEDRMEVRKKIIEPLKEQGYLVKIEDYTNKVGYSQRTNVVIEPRLSKQWFLAMKELAKPALDNVMTDNIQFFPPKFKNTYRHWMENVHDWCISRQLWWGHRIPAWYWDESDDFVVAATAEDALILVHEKTGNKYLKTNDLKQDDDVLDTWFSSWLWPISVFDGIRNPNNEEINYYYPTSVLVTGHDIMFFWVARMIISGYEYKQHFPFKDVYYTGMVRDKQGRKMSKSLGNSPEPLDLIRDFSADGVRMGLLLCSPAGNDLPFDESLTEQGRNFNNKIWNAFRLVQGWESANIPQPAANIKAISWMQSRINKVLNTMNDHFEKYRLSEALMEAYRLFWDDFSSWYLEIVKPAYGQPIDQQTLLITKEIFEKLLKLLHPFVPFITEELWQHLAERKNGESIMVSAYPTPESIDKELIDKFEFVKEIIAQVRKIRKDRNIPFKEELELCVKENVDSVTLNEFYDIIIKSCGLSTIRFVKDQLEGAISFLVKTSEYYIPLGDKINKEEELKKLNEELNYFEGFLEIINKKLNNDKFVNNAKPEVVDLEKKKKAEAEMKISAIKEQLKAM